MHHDMNVKNVIAGLVCLAFAGYAYWLTGSVAEGIALDPLGGRFLPRALAVALGLFSVALTITGALGVRVAGGQAAAPKATVPAPPPPESPEGAIPEGATPEGATPAGATPEAAVDDEVGAPGDSPATVVAYVAVMGLYVWLLPFTGFLLTSLVAFTGFIALLGERNIGKALLVAAVITGGLYGLFGMVFNIRLPAGSLF